MTAGGSVFSGVGRNGVGLGGAGGPGGGWEARVEQVQVQARGRAAEDPRDGGTRQQL